MFHLFRSLEVISSNSVSGLAINP